MGILPSSPYSSTLYSLLLLPPLSPPPPPGTSTPSSLPLGSSCQVMFVLPPLSFPNGWGKISGDRGTSYVPLLLLLLSSPSSCPFSCSFPLSPCCPPVSSLVRQNFISTVTPLKYCAKIHHPPVLECLKAHLAVLPSKWSRMVTWRLLMASSRLPPPKQSSVKLGFCSKVKYKLTSMRP